MPPFNDAITCKKAAVARADDVQAALYRVLADNRGSTPEVIREQVGGTGEIDSLEGIELIIAVETEFDVRIEDSELTSQICRSIPQMAELVAMRMAANNGQQRGQDEQGRAAGRTAHDRGAPATAGRSASGGA